MHMIIYYNQSKATFTPALEPWTYPHITLKNCMCNAIVRLDIKLTIVAR